MFHFNTTRNITASISFVSKYGAHVNTSMNLNNLLLFWSSFLLRTNGLGQPTVGWSAQFLQTPNSKLVFMLHLIIEGCRVADTDTGHNAQSATRHSVQCVHCSMCPQCVQGPDCPVSGSPADLQCECKQKQRGSRVRVFHFQSRSSLVMLPRPGWTPGLGQVHS